MGNKIKYYLFIFLLVGVAQNAPAQVNPSKETKTSAENWSITETLQQQRKVPEKYLSCKSNSQCVIYKDSCGDNWVVNKYSKQKLKRYLLKNTNVKSCLKNENIFDDYGEIEILNTILGNTNLHCRNGKCSLNEGNKAGDSFDLRQR